MFQITVENVGRTAVTITNPTIDLYPSRARPSLWLSRGIRALLSKFSQRTLPIRRTMGTSLASFRDMSDKPDRQRVEPFDMATYLMHAEVIALKFREGPTMWARGSVRVAGRREPVLSSHRAAIRLGGGRWGFRPEKPRPDMVAFRAMPDTDWSNAAEAAAVVQELFEDGTADTWEVLEAVQERVGLVLDTDERHQAMTWGRSVADALATYEYVAPRRPRRPAKAQSQKADDEDVDRTQATSKPSESPS